MSSLTSADLVLMITALIAAALCRAQILHIYRLATEFETYSGKEKETRAGIVQAMFDQVGLDSHQKILRADALVSAASGTMLLAWLLSVVVVTW
ncbi:MAG: hypothetical protein ACR2QJ_03145 [Geminicoccaceae bacterium]